MSTAEDLPIEVAPRFLPSEVRATWRKLLTSGPSEETERRGSGSLPEPVERWAQHTLADCESMPHALRMDMHGEIKLSRWQPFRASQVLTRKGFIWAAKAGRGAVRVSGFDSYVYGSGQMLWKLFGLIPVMKGSGADVTRSASGRLAGERMLLPGASIDEEVVWQSGDERHATAAITAGVHAHHVTVEVDDVGALRAVTLPRWGAPCNGSFAEHPFGVELRAERSFGGHLIPTRLRAGWWYGTDRWAEGEFFRATIENIRLT